MISTRVIFVFILSVSSYAQVRNSKALIIFFKPFADFCINMVSNRVSVSVLVKRHCQWLWQVVHPGNDDLGSDFANFQFGQLQWNKTKRGQIDTHSSCKCYCAIYLPGEIFVKIIFEIWNNSESVDQARRPDNNSHVQKWPLARQIILAWRFWSVNKCKLNLFFEMEKED